MVPRRLASRIFQHPRNSSISHNPIYVVFGCIRNMSQNFCCFFSLKTGAFIMSFIFVLGGISEIMIGSVEMILGNQDQIFCGVLVSVGAVSIVSGIFLIYATVKALERHILLYLLLSSAVLFIVTVYTGMNMFDIKLLLIIFIASIFLWYGQYSMYHFYLEVASYNTVQSDVVAYKYSTSGCENSAIDEKNVF